MSSRLPFTYTQLTVALLGVALLAVGGVLTYYSLSIDWAMGPKVLTPIGVVVILFGLVLLTSKDG
jgi:uncharacterized membrane protein YiaA